jgi:hypothetical protein
MNLVSEERARLASARMEEGASASAAVWLCLLLFASIERGLANEIWEREVFLFHRPEWGSV